MIKQTSANRLTQVWKLAKTTIVQAFAVKNTRRIVFASVFLTLSSINALGDTLHIAVASNFITPIKQLALLFKQETGHQLTLSFGSSGKLYAQIQHGAPFDVFLSADQAKAKTLIAEQLAQADSFVIYARGKLALWSVNPMTSITLKENLLAARKIAIANPKLAPYGNAAEESLRGLGIWPRIKDKLVQGENIAQTYQFIYTQNADLGLVALSQVLAGETKGHTQIIPSRLYSEIKQAAVILSGTQHHRLAKKFMAFLMRPDIQKKILQYGYSTKQH